MYIEFVVLSWFVSIMFLIGFTGIYFNHCDNDKDRKEILNVISFFFCLWLCLSCISSMFIYRSERVVVSTARSFSLDDVDYLTYDTEKYEKGLVSYKESVNLNHRFSRTFKDGSKFDIVRYKCGWLCSFIRIEPVKDSDTP